MFDKIKLLTSKKPLTIALVVIVLISLVIGGVVLYRINSEKNVNPDDSQASNNRNRIVSIIEAPGTLADYWNGNAELRYKNRYVLQQANDELNSGIAPGVAPTNAYGYAAGPHIEVMPDGTWYMVSRHLNWNDKPSYCGLTATNNTVIRKSTDKGVTWSKPVNINKNEPGKEWECYGLDGDIFYDTASSKWIYVFQCLKRSIANQAWSGKWNICYLERKNTDPFGIFVENPSIPNPIVKSGSLASKICSYLDQTKKCYSNMGSISDEGTADIFDKKNGFYYLTFHVAESMKELEPAYDIDGSKDGIGYRNGYRVMAKTADFKNWITSANDLPGDAFLSYQDTANWRETWKQTQAKQKGKPVITFGNTGFGAGRTFKEGDYYYTISESMDISIGCFDGQTWDWGIFRQNVNKLNNKVWEQPPFKNPIIYSNKAPERKAAIPIPKNEMTTTACNPAYMGFVKDNDGKIYLHFSKDVGPEESLANSGIYFYEIVKTGNLLKNSNFWKCNIEDWQKTGNGNISVVRSMFESSDYNCHAAVQCASQNGSTCTAGQKLFQEINVSNQNIGKIKFGGRFTIKSGNLPITSATEATGTLNLIELDSNSSVLATHTTSISAGQEYNEQKDIEKIVELKSQTTKLRLEFIPTSTYKFKIDELYVTPTTKILRNGETPTPTPTNASTPTKTPSPTPTVTTTMPPRPTVTPTIDLKANLLPNGSFATCSLSGWQRFNMTQVTNWIITKQSGSTDCYMELNCNSTIKCVAGQSVYRDISILNKNIKKIKFGGTVNVKAPQTSGIGFLTVFELKNGQILGQHRIDVNLNSNKQLFSKEVSLNSSTTTLRYQFYLSSPNNYQLDDLFILSVQ